MRKIFIVLFILFAACSAGRAQGPGPQTQLARKMYSGTAVPSFNCNPGPAWRDVGYNQKVEEPSLMRSAPQIANLLRRSESLSGSYHESREYQCYECGDPVFLKSKPYRVNLSGGGPRCRSCWAKEQWQRRGVHKPSEYACRDCNKTLTLKSRRAILKLKDGQPRCRSCSRKIWYQTHEQHNKGIPMSAATKEKLRQAINATWTPERRKTHGLLSVGRPSARKGKPSICSGANHYNWKGGITPVNQALRASGVYRDWRLAVFRRDRFRCVRCGNKPRKIEADHVQPWAQNLATRFDVGNGQTLCVLCHKTKTAQERRETRRVA